MNRQVSRDVSPAAPQLFAQYLICAIFITISVMTEHDDYVSRASQVLWRLSSVTMLYFILAIVSMTSTMNKVTVQFGWLIVAVIFLKSVSGIGRTFNVLAGQGTGETTTELSSDNTSGGVTPDTHTFLN